MAPLTKSPFAKIIGVCNTVMYFLSPFVAIYAVMLILASSVGMIHGQSSTEMRIEKLESDSVDQKISLDHRLTVLETTLKDIQDSSTWFKISTGGTGLLILKAVLEILTPKLPKGPSQDE